MIAIGKPGQTPRMWFDGPGWLLRDQMQDGEVSAVADVDADGHPIAATMPSESDA